MTATEPGAVRALFPAEPPRSPELFDQVIEDLDCFVRRGLLHWQHPGFFDYFPANALLAGVLGDLVSMGLGVLGLSWQSSPALSELEEVRNRLGAPDGRAEPPVDRRHSGHRVDQYAGGADLRPRAGNRLRAGAWRPAGAVLAADRLCVRPDPQLGRRRRCWRGSAATSCAGYPATAPMRCAPTRSTRIPGHGQSGSTGPVPLISPRRQSTGAR